ncbi:MAG TPA: DUF5668 domain-containing protein, partial [Bacteroidia bacterium]|nr:DUF5668 domain-containing protein [Bacteroidia bacterium]
KRGKIFGGMTLVIAGSLFFAKEVGAAIPDWVFTWKMLLIAIGLASGFKHSFRSSGWFILILIGSAFIISDQYPQLMINHLIWPSILILIGLFIMFKPRRKCNNHYYRRRWRHQPYFDKSQDSFNYSKDDATSEDLIDITSVMSGTKKSVVSKNFKGGEISAVLGGAEIDFSQADFSGTISMEVTAVLGGIQLIFPAHWEIESQLVAMMGGIDDKRPIQTSSTDTPKKIILKGTVVMGGIEISSY